MVARTWTGGGNNKASDAKDWTPKGSPRPGDSLLISNGGTIKITGNALAGDVLSVEPSPTGRDPTLNLKNAHVVLGMINQPTDIGSVESLHFIMGIAGADSVAGTIEDATVDLNGDAHLLLTGSMSFLGVTGGPDSEIINDGTMSVLPGSGSTTIDTNLTGRGVIDINQQSLLALTINGAVGSGQTIDIIGNNSLTLDKPLAFSGAISLHQDGPSGFSISLVGLVATSYEYRNDILCLFDGNRVVDRLNLTNPPADMLVEQTGSGVSIVFGEGPALPPHLPVHT